ncbi:phosphoenolpyruvate--protein phosphotransferase [Synergistales bacterium]|nr:phosphoenolpyruvate--protein phosphotransferase [Synergistales bacterium]
MSDDKSKLLDEGWETSGEITILSPEGFHARPATVLVKSAKKFSSDIKLIKGSVSVNAKSLVSVMSMALSRGEKLAVAARGSDAKEAIAALSPMLSSSPGNTPPNASSASLHSSAVQPASAQSKRAPTKPTPPQNGVFLGISASPGIVTGVARKLAHRDTEIHEEADSPGDERRKLNEAISAAKEAIKTVQDAAKSRAGAKSAEIFGAHTELLDDPDMLAEADALISRHKSAPFAWRTAYKAQAAKLSALKEELFAQRASDIEDVGRRVLSVMTGSPSVSAEYEPDTILIAEELTPSDTSSFGESVIGFCTVKGGAASHIAILARSFGIPAIVGADASLMEIEDGSRAILDGGNGELRLNPNEAETEKLKQERAASEAKRASDMANTLKPAHTTDSRLIYVAANIGGTEDAERAASLGCDGVGLLRSEFLFMDRNSAPTEAEQSGAYINMAKAIGKGRPFVVRTLDVGGDKHLPYIKSDPEENPFLGVRGLRLSLLNRDIFEAQLGAILKAAEFCDLHVMFPMVSTVDEFHEAKEILLGRASAMGVSGVKAGVMIEVPSAALLADRFAEEADFLSIGTNDLTQYTMASDRGNPKLAHISDGLNPAVLSLIDMTLRGAEGKDCRVGVCGGMAGDAEAIPILIGLGVKELSVSVPAIPSVKASVRSLSLGRCQRLAREALNMKTSSEVREGARNFLKGLPR